MRDLGYERPGSSVALGDSRPPDPQGFVALGLRQQKGDRGGRCRRTLWIGIAWGNHRPSIPAVKEVARLLNAMRGAGVITDYALFGAAAQMRYTEAVATFDADVLVALPSPERIDALRPLYQFCAERGWQPEGEAIRVEAWPVQFIPVFSPLTQEALALAETADFDGVPFRVVKANHLAVIALSVGRGKDYARILALIEAKAVTAEGMAELAARHGLAEAWTRFQRRFLDAP